MSVGTRLNDATKDLPPIIPHPVIHYDAIYQRHVSTDDKCTACEGKGFIQGFEAHGVIASKSLAKPKIVTCPKCNGTGRR